MDIDILNLEPTTVKPGLEGKIITVAGLPKCGKSTFASKADSPFFISTEPGLGLLSGLYAQPCNNWRTFKKIVKQLDNPLAKEKYKTVVIDTIGILWEQCAKFIWTQKNDGSDLSDYTTGMKQNVSMPEFSGGINELCLMGYTIILICHNTAKDVPNELGFKHGTEIIIDLPKRPRNFVFGLCDLLINVITEPTATGADEAIMYLRQSTYNGVRVEAGGRYGNIIKEKAPFKYETLEQIVKEADSKSLEQGATMTSSMTAMQAAHANDSDSKPWDEVMNEVNATLAKVSEKVNAGDTDLSAKVKSIIAGYLGKDNKISDAVPSQQELVEGALADLKELLA